MIKAVIFDMDGLMIDSEVVTYRCYQEVMAKMNETISLEFYKTLLGKSPAHGKKRFEEDYGTEFPFDQVIKDVHIRMNEIFETEGVPLKKGLIELLSYLKDNNYKTIVATSSHRERVDRILKQANITQYFDDVICGNEVKNGKPAPDIFLAACSKLGVQNDEAVVLEDSEAGIQAAYSGDIKVICVPDMKYPEEEFVNMTTKIVDSLLDVIEFVKEN